MKVKPKYQTRETNFLLRSANSQKLIELMILANRRRIVQATGDGAWIVVNSRRTRVENVHRHINTLIRQADPQLVTQGWGVLTPTEEGRRCLRGALAVRTDITSVKVVEAVEAMRPESVPIRY